MTYVNYLAIVTTSTTQLQKEMTTIDLHVYDKAFAVSETEKTAIIKAALYLLGWATLREWLSEQRQYEIDGIGGGVGGALSALCQGACEMAGICPTGKTFVVRETK